MIVALLAFALVAQVQPQAVADDSEIDVIAQRVRRVQIGLTRAADGKLVCNVQVSSGEPQIDDLICRDSAKCLRKSVPTAQTQDCIAKRQPRLIQRVTALNRKLRKADA